MRHLLFAIWNEDQCFVESESSTYTTKAREALAQAYALMDGNNED